MKTSPYVFPPLSAADLRRWAMQCGTQAHDPRLTGEERERLLKMQKALFVLADDDDWLNGKTSAGLRRAS